MTGSSLTPIIVPIVAFIALAVWLGVVFWADAHPWWKAHGPAPGREVTRAESPPAVVESGVHHGSEMAAAAARDRKAR